MANTEKKIRAGIVGYGNLGRGVESVIKYFTDFELVAILSRRSPDELSIATPGVLKLHIEEALSLKGKIDVMILCGGSVNDLPTQGPEFAKHFVTVDSFDTHAKIPEYYKAMNEISSGSNLTSIISAGWDPGLFSLNRVIAQSVLPSSSGSTFWGKGLSQGHSTAIRMVDGVEAAAQYTVPLDDAVNKARKGESASLTTKDKHLRECFVVVKEGADKSKIEEEIKTMPNYFADYNTVVHFINIDEFNLNHNKMPHGGFVIQSGNINGNTQTIEFSLSLDSNPEFTASVLVAYARAAARLYSEGKTGAFTVFDIPPAYLSSESDENLRKNLL